MSTIIKPVTVAAEVAVNRACIIDPDSEPLWEKGSIRSSVPIAIRPPKAYTNTKGVEKIVEVARCSGSLI